MISISKNIRIPGANGRSPEVLPHRHLARTSIPLPGIVKQPSIYHQLIIKQSIELAKIVI